MSAVPKQKYTMEEYAHLFLRTEELLEYFDGDVVAMTATKLAHSLIGGNLLCGLREVIEQRQCRVFTIGLAVKTDKAPPFRLPDLVALFDQPQIEEFYEIEMLRNPLFLAEVLSPATAAYDRDEKFLAYQAIDSFQEYLLVAQDRPHVTRYVRQADGQWLRADVIGLESSIRLESLDASLALSDIYRSVAFPKQPESSRRPQPPLTIA